MSEKRKVFKVVLAYYFIMVKKKFETLEILFLCSIGAVLLGMILPWIQIPILGSFSALKSGWGVFFFFVVAISGGSFFWKKHISQSVLFVLSGLFILSVIERVIALGSEGFSLDLGILGTISIFNFLGVGIYLTIIASILLFAFSFLLLKKNNPKALKISAIVLGVLFALGLIYGMITGFNSILLQTQEGENQENIFGELEDSSVDGDYLECYTDYDCSSKEECKDNKCVAKQETPKGPGYSRSNPVSVNTPLTTSFGYSWSQMVDAEITLLNVKRGESAWTMIKEANMFNDEPAQGKEYLLAKFRFKVLSTSDDKSYSIRDYYFDAVSSDGVVYDSSWVVDPEPSLSKEVYAGGSSEGWIVFEINQNDANPLISFNKDEDGELWFSLN